ncbi:putative Endonuclease [Vibrio nigripulchritudo SFn27]|uniref:endonuclease n=1 Tax=Vibrio nigripulchritudo TaxID=28173 RepID=UPI0003B18C0C|nr:endonuclease [Vibrio nigripulchritudo]CCN85917.1 putative Endonuclease [Vibrio nigripulchritudo BLFn1]CCN91910.1 putative Endonuclease [Vibrio nigripulchritudo SFn27]CCN97714.1 putative Endonuclease [Vibrio nigripulchritudo ENn2]CCO43945.1 putative Endonuclease [Vibrio nigripulchritudo SFn135]CCO56025.1 putative Endonuclease [Vibrio nigripulchritudo Wn13]
MNGITYSWLCLSVLAFGIAHAAIPETWTAAKNMADDAIYNQQRTTLYCGCSYHSDNDSDGSGDIDGVKCGLAGVSKWKKYRDEIQWEHIVPAALMPVGSFSCWTNKALFPQCASVSSGRKCCESISLSGKAMMFDLHNLAPSAAQLNQYRRDNLYGEVSEEDAYEGFGERCNAKDAGEVFEPPTCKKGDVARVWFYMEMSHGVNISDEQRLLFQRWSEADPVSPWESTRNALIKEKQGNSNPFVEGITPDPSGACTWE